METNAPEANAGSRPIRYKTTGMTVPAKPATTIFITMAKPITYPTDGNPNHRIPTKLIKMVHIIPFMRPTKTSLRITRHTFAPVKSSVDNARTASVSQ
jgi:hypothetical protein